ncbi:hypothetical protein HDE_01503 [Halotydeus destructor]|nr:hypothetical protein HDE_01503 [Halotydeus destructor]
MKQLLVCFIFLHLAVSVLTESSEEPEPTNPVPSLRYKCKEADKLARRKQCFDGGHIVTFIPGGYLCCPNGTSDADLMTIGAAAFWRRGQGFCGRGACEKCEKPGQECVVFGDEDVFCCPSGYKPIG